MNSLTQPRAAGAAALQEAAAASPEVRAVQVGSTLLSPSRIMQGFGPVGDKLAASLTRKNMSGIADRLFSGTGMEFLNRTGMMAPNSQALTSAVAEFLGQQGGDSDTAAGRPPPPGLNITAPRNQFAPAYGP
jgi:hypothetical protein